MRLIPWTREGGLSRLQQQMNRLFDDFFTEEPAGAAWLPAVDVSETEDTIVARAELPGIDAKDIEISVVQDHLVLKGEKHHEEETKDKNWHRVERRYGAFSRTVPLPCSVDLEKTKAEMENGVLTVTLAKTEAVKPRRIDVRAK